MDARKHKLAVLREVQANKDAKISDIAGIAGVGEAQVHKILNDAMAAGEIVRSTTILDPAKFDLKTLCFVQLKLKDNAPARRNATVAKIREFPNVQGIYRIPGDFDLLVRVRGDADVSGRFADHVQEEGNVADTATITTSGTILDTLNLTLPDA